MADQKNVAYPSAAYRWMADDWDLIDDLLAGTRKMREQGSSYLAQETAERLSDYKKRLSRAYLKPALRNAIDTATGQIFKFDVNIDKVDAKLQPFLEDVDLRGNDITSFLASAFRNQITYGHCHLLAEYSATEPGSTLATALAESARPYGVNVSPRNVIGWRPVPGVGPEVLETVRFVEWMPDPQSAWDDDTTRPIIRVVTADHWEIWRQVDSQRERRPPEELRSNLFFGGDWILDSQGPMTLGELPWTTIYSERVDFMVSRPPFLDLAWLNLAHYQAYSDYRNILHVAQVPFLFASGMDPTSEIVVGVSSATIVNDPQADLRWVEHSGAAINAGRQDLIDLEADMDRIGNAFLETDASSSAPKTATAVQIEEVARQASLGGIVRSLEDGANMFLYWMGRWIGLEDAGTLTISRPQVQPLITMPETQPQQQKDQLNA